jgi:hypothetical protein
MEGMSRVITTYFSGFLAIRIPTSRIRIYNTKEIEECIGKK